MNAWDDGFQMHAGMLQLQIPAVIASPNLDV